MSDVGIAYPAFKSSFDKYFTGLEVVDPQHLDKYKLIIFSGGEDINPSRYGEENKYSSYNDRRDRIEFDILDAISRYNSRRTFPNRIKILGVCRGHQLICAYLGAMLVQDLYFGGVDHHGSHAIEYINSNELISIIGNKVNSLHHQGVMLSNTPSGLTPIGHHKGVIELAVGNSTITTQFHPEWMDESIAIPFFNYIKHWSSSDKGLDEVTPISPKKKRNRRSTTTTTTTTSYMSPADWLVSIDDLGR